MKIINASIQIEDELNGIEMLKKIERAGKTCYKSEWNISEDSYLNFVKNILKRGHESVIEHASISVRIICDRGVTHEIVRHRIASYSQESTRYCNYTNDRFGSELAFIQPNFWKEAKDEKSIEIWKETLEFIEKKYFEMIESGAKPEEARSILPNSLKTEIVVTMNLREWRHFLKLRTDKASHPQIREVAELILEEFRNKIPVLFDTL